MSVVHSLAIVQISVLVHDRTLIGPGATPDVVGVTQACVLQLCDSLKSLGQAVPPLAAGVMTVRVRVFVPLPHSLEHAPQAP